MTHIDILDVTRIEPRLKHATIFEHFEALKAGEGFQISNDHDPRPLYNQLLDKHGPVFSWRYLEKGPQRWVVHIAKHALDEKEETVGELAVKDIRIADAFKKLGIDFCCGGRKTVREALAESGISQEQLDHEIVKASSRNPGVGNLDFNAWDLSFLADYIKNVHHQYVRENGPILEQMAEKVATRHGGEHPELEDMLSVVRHLLDELYAHLEAEEKIVFPLIKQLENGEVKQPDAVVGPIEQMEADHEDAGDELRTLRRLSRDYQLPQGACNSYTYLFNKLEEFESDLFQHIHLENNILFPKAVAMEKELRASSN